MANGEGTLRIQELLVSLGKCLTVHNAPLGDVRGLNNMIVHERCRNCVECTMYMKACNFSCLKIISEFQEEIEPKTCITLVGCWPMPAVLGGHSSNVLISKIFGSILKCTLRCFQYITLLWHFQIVCL